MINESTTGEYLLVVDGGEASTGIGHLDVEDLGAGNDILAGAGTHVTGDGGAEGLVDHHQGIELRDIPNDGLVQACETETRRKKNIRK